MCLVTQSYLTLCDPMDCSLPGSFVHGDSPGKNAGVGCHAVHQGIFPTQGSNRGFLHCRWILYQLRYYFYFNNLEVKFWKKVKISQYKKQAWCPRICVRKAAMLSSISPAPYQTVC